MDSGGQHKNGRHQMEYYRGSHPPWNVISQHQGNEQNALAANRKTMSIIAEKDAAIHERNLALAEKKEALAARDVAIMQREKAHAERDQALMERDHALAVLQYQESSINFPLGSGMQRGVKRSHLPSTRVTDMDKISNYTGEGHAVNVFPESAKSMKRKRPKESKAALFKSPRKVNKIGEDLNEQVLFDGKKYKSEWESQAVGLNLIAFDEATMPGPVCSCTGVPRQCYKWGNGGWQSSCCTITMSEYPLPQMPNKRHARVGGRKMSGSVFTRLLSRLAAGGHDLSLPLDLKDYWARHGTNRYITIK